MSRKIEINYATKSQFKKDEIHQCLALIEIGNAPFTERAEDIFSVSFPVIETSEPLERDLSKMVRHKAMSAYASIMAPCVVEHAGLIIPSLEHEHYPGGLTQPMYDALNPEDFVRSLSWSGMEVIARAVVGYCDGLDVHTFVGETRGELIPTPKGERQFYWDTIFKPLCGDGRTYAEIAKEDLRSKMMMSQSRKAFEQCLNHIKRRRPVLFQRS